MRTHAPYGIIGISLIIASASQAQVDYRFERMWPTLEQPWYFIPNGVEIGPNGAMHVKNNERVDKLDPDGNLLTSFPALGQAITVDADQNIYIGDSSNPPDHRLRKYDRHGQLLADMPLSGLPQANFAIADLAVGQDGFIYVGNIVLWKYTTNGELVAPLANFGTNPGEFFTITAIDIDSSGAIYASDLEKVLKFDSDGNFLFEWELEIFGQIEGLSVGPNDHIYVSGRDGRIQEFDTNGTYVTEWASADFNEEQGFPVQQVAVSPNGDVYATAQFGELRRFDPSGTVLQKWDSSGSEAGHFQLPISVAVDSNGDVYVGDWLNFRIQKYDANADFLLEWGTYGSDTNEFRYPEEIEIAPDGSVYVLDDSRIQHYDSSGNFIAEWPEFFFFERGLAVAPDGSVYVMDYDAKRIHKYDSAGNLLLMLGSPGTGPGQFVGMLNISVGPDGSVYAGDGRGGAAAYARIQKFDSAGDFLLEWGSIGTGPGQFASEPEIVVGDDGTVYAFDIDISGSGQRRIQTFDENGAFENEWVLPDGVNAGQLGEFFSDFDVDSDGALYFAETFNNRIQKFVPVTVPSDARAIVVAAGGPYAGNNLWDATQYAANFAYRALRHQGFSKDHIYYISADTDLDLDEDGIGDDVDADATNANLQFALESWAPGAESLVVYLVNHGGADQFRMSGTETLTAAQLAQWVATADLGVPGLTLVIYDACQSGSFLTELQGANRLVMTGSSGTETAKFISSGAISFSNFFWEQVFNGESVGTAFGVAQQAMAPYQTAQISDPGAVASSTHLGNANDFNLDKPVIGGPVGIVGGSVLALGSTATIFAENVVDPTLEGTISRVWAALRPPEFIEPTKENAVIEFPTVEMYHVGGNRYEGTTDEFSVEGTYNITIHAIDDNTETAQPKSTTLTVNSPLRKKAIIAVGADPASPDWPAAQAMAELAYETLVFQQFADDPGGGNEDIKFYAPITFSSGVDGLLTQSNLNFAINTWAATDGQALVIYLIGEGNQSSFRLNATQSLTPATLTTWLNNLQNLTDGIGGSVTVVLDFDHAGAWIPVLANPPTGRDRFSLASALGTQRANLEAAGRISFSNYFWTQVLNGANLREAFRTAESSMRFAAGGQEATFDDNGNGTPDDPLEGGRMKRFRIGAGIQLAGVDPVASLDPAPIELNGSGTTNVQFDGISSLNTIASVRATITPPYPTFGFNVASVPTTNVGGGSFAATLDGFDYFGPYTVAAVAIDVQGNISRPARVVVKRTDAPDVFEVDNTFTTATWIGLDGPMQPHGFHNGSDVDWVSFGAPAGESVRIETSQLGSTSDTVLTLYNVNGTSVLAMDDNGSPTETNASLILYSIPADGVYYVRVTQGTLATSGANSEYTLSVSREVAPVLSPGQLGGLIKVAGSNVDVPDSGLNIMLQGTDCSGVDQNCYVQSNDPHISVQPDGRVYAFALDTGPYEVTVSASGFQSAQLNGTLQAGSALELSFELTDASGQNATTLRNQFKIKDTNSNGVLNLSESGLGSTMFNLLDLNHNGTITLAELLQATVGPTGVTDPVHVDFDYSGDEAGTDAQPFNTLAEGAAFVAPGGMVILEAGNSTETPRLSGAMVLVANGGTVTVGSN